MSSWRTGRLPRQSRWPPRHAEEGLPRTKHHVASHATTTPNANTVMTTRWCALSQPPCRTWWVVRCVCGAASVCLRVVVVRWCVEYACALGRRRAGCVVVCVDCACVCVQRASVCLSRRLRVCCAVRVCRCTHGWCILCPPARAAVAARCVCVCSLFWLQTPARAAAMPVTRRPPPRSTARRFALRRVWTLPSPA